MILLYNDFIKEGTDNSINTPNHTDNLSNNNNLNKDFKKTNKIQPPEAIASSEDIEPINIVDYDTFSKYFHNNTTDNTQYNLNKNLPDF